MDRHELNRMFDRLVPAQEKEEAGLDRLLQTERKVYPVKRLKKWAVAGIAAAIMLVTCAAAVVTGIDQRLLDFMGWGSQAQELLAPGAMCVDITAEDNGAILHITQVLRDRYSIMMMAEFTAPEGTVLDPQKKAYFVKPNIDFLYEEDGAPQDDKAWAGMIRQKILEDDNAQDNRLTMLFWLSVPQGIPPEWSASAFRLSLADLIRIDTSSGRMEDIPLYSGNWSCEVPLPGYDMGQAYGLDVVAGTLEGVDITAKEIYLSPMTLQITLTRDTPAAADRTLKEEAAYRRWLFFVNTAQAVLTDRNGESLASKVEASEGSEDKMSMIYRLPEIVDPARFLGGTLSLEFQGQTLTVPLNDLTPTAE